MSALVQAQANAILNVTLGVSSLTAPTTPMLCHLTTTAPTNTVAGTALSGTGSTPLSITFGSASAGQSTGPTGSALQWTNGSGGTWSIVGVEIWDSAGSPVRWWFGSWTGQPISVSASSVFQVNVAGLTVQLS